MSSKADCLDIEVEEAAYAAEDDRWIDMVANPQYHRW
jgi:hypothetical protein